MTLAEQIDTPEGRASLSAGDIRGLLSGDDAMAEWTPEELADLRPEALATFLASMEYPALQGWIDDAFDYAEQNNEQPLIALAWRCNDIAQLLKHGTKPEEVTSSPYAGITTKARVAELESAPEPDEDEATPENRFRLLTAAELALLPAMRWRVRGLLPAEGLAAIYGPSGGGKSFLVLDLLGAIAEGRAWFDHAVTSGCPCVYVGLEGEAGVAQRVKAYVSRHGTPARLRVILTPLDIRRADDRGELADAIRNAGMAGGIVCLDTLNRAAPGIDENDSREMGLLIEAAKAIQSDLGGLVVLVHHAGKDATRGLRGHSSLHAALDAVLEVTRTGERREWKLAKSKDGEDDKAQAFRLEVVELGEDADGWPVSSCVVEPERDMAAEMKKALPPGGGNMRIAWDVLGGLLRESKQFGQGGAPITRPCVSFDEALDAIAPRLACDIKRQRERAQQAVNGLVSRRACVCFNEGWLWLP